MRAFALAAAAALFASQAEAVTFYGSLDGVSPGLRAGADITLWTNDGWETAYWHSRSTGDFSEAEFDLGANGLVTRYYNGKESEPWALFYVGPGVWSGRIISADPEVIPVSRIIQEISLNYWCWFGCEYPGWYSDNPSRDVFTRVDEGNDWQIRYVLGAFIPAPNPSPVPLPAAAPLLLAGIGSVYVAGRKRRAKP